MGLDVESGATSVLYEDTSGDVWEYTPRWSGDGTRLVVEHDVFASNRLDEEQTLSSELRVVDPTTGTATPLKGTVGAEAPDWSPTADLIVFTDDGNLFTIHADGSHKKRLTRFKARRESAIQPTFTPDGTGVVFTWVTGMQGSGVESTVAAVLRLSDGTVTAVQGADGATHARLQP
jgi:Tol biopolymer transport system component